MLVKTSIHSVVVGLVVTVLVPACLLAQAPPVEPAVPPTATGDPAGAPPPATQPATRVTEPAAAAPDAYVLRQKGLRAMADGIYTAATRFFADYRQATKNQEPDFADATALLAQAHLHQNEAAKAADALEFHKANSEGLTDRYYIDSLQYWRAAVILAFGKYEEAIGIATPLLGDDRSKEFRPQTLELLGDAYAKLEKWDQVQDVLASLLRESPAGDNALRARLGLVKAYLAGNRLELAEKMLTLVREHHPDARARTVHLYHILLWLRQGKLDDAYKLYRRIETERPQEPDRDWWLVVSQMADRLIAEKRHEEALAILPHAAVLAVDPNEMLQAKLRRAECLIALKKVELAIDALETFKKEHPDVREAIAVQLQLAELLRTTKNFVVASEYFQQIATDTTVSQALRFRAAYSRGWCFNEAGQFANAVDAFSAGAELGVTRDQQAESTLLAGDAAFRLENFTKAALLYQAVADNYRDTSQAEGARFKQGVARSKAGLFSNAAVVFGQFITEYPESPMREDAQLERGIALRQAGSFKEAMDELKSFAAATRDSTKAARALAEGHEAAKGANDIPVAIFFLSEIIDKHEDAGPLYAHALYQRAHLFFLQKQYEQALKDCWLFTDKFADLPLAADVYLWLGDHYANRGESIQSEKYYTALVNKQPGSDLAPLALFEAAKSCFRRNALDDALHLLNQLTENYAKAPAVLLSEAQMLRGDVLAEQGKFADALPLFQGAAEKSPDAPEGWSALGRLGEMYYTLADEDEAYLEKALDCFTRVASQAKGHTALWEKATYRKAKTCEKLGRADTALNDYLDIVYQYDIDVKEGKVPDWYYFARASYDAARLLVEAKSYRLAARTYERLAAAGIPTASEALERARQIREAYGLNE